MGAAGAGLASGRQHPQTTSSQLGTCRLASRGGALRRPRRLAEAANWRAANRPLRARSAPAARSVARPAPLRTSITTTRPLPAALRGPSHADNRCGDSRQPSARILMRGWTCESESEKEEEAPCGCVTGMLAQARLRRTCTWLAGYLFARKTTTTTADQTGQRPLFDEVCN